MNAGMTLSSARILLRRWRDEDRDAFAAMNSDARVMEFFRSRLARAESDAIIDRIDKHFSERDFGLWAVEVPDVVPFIGPTPYAAVQRLSVQRLETAVLSAYIDTIDRWPDNWAASRRH